MASSARHHHHRHHRSRTAQLRQYREGYHVPTRAPACTTHIFTVSSSARPLRQIISSVGELRAELEAIGDGAAEGGKVLVVKGREVGRMAEWAGVERVFVEGRAREGGGGGGGGGGRTVYRGKRGMWWEDVRGGVGLWMGGRMPVMLIEEDSSARGSQREPRRRMSSAARGSSDRSKSRHDLEEESAAAGEGLEERLAEEMDASRTAAEQLPGIVCELVYERWVDYLLAEGLRVESRDEYAAVVKALARNAETARTRSGLLQKTTTTTYTHWNDLLVRITTALGPCHQLPSSSSPDSNNADDQEDTPKTANERSLDRITYLGGLLLPLTVVSSVLAIEGDYGPEGDNFWVFWVASAVGSLIAVAVIYVDQMRRVDVWVEGVVAGEEGGEGVLGGVLAGDAGLLGERRRGERARVVTRWTKGELGWKGAVKRVSGLERWWPSQGVRFQRPAAMERLVMEV